MSFNATSFSTGYFSIKLSTCLLLFSVPPSTIMVDIISSDTFSLTQIPQLKKVFNFGV
jgi:hypothetical protein